MCSQQTWFTSKSNKTLIFLFFECNCAKYWKIYLLIP
jgi:hypothetical protein